MATTVNSGFSGLLSTIRATPAETKAASGHRSSTYQKLKNEFGATAFFRTGSFGNGTNISGHSDVDYFCVIPHTQLKQDSSSTLALVAAALRDRFPLTTGIRVNGPAVRLPFGLDGAEATEVVPVDATGRTFLGFRQFDMPDGNGGWMFSAPESHNAYVQLLDNRLNGTVKPLIRFLKAWKYFRKVPINSFYLEMRVAEYASREPSIIFDIDLLRLMRLMRNEALAPLNDPRFPSDGTFLNACNTELQRREALAAINRGLERAEAAVSAKQAGNIPLAFDRWGVFFNHVYPQYSAA